MRNVDKHSQPVHFFYNRAATLIQAMPFGLRTAGVGEPIGPVVGRELRRSQTELIELAQHVEISVEIEPSFEIENGSDLSSLVDTFDIVSIIGKLNGGVIRRNLPFCKVQQPQGVLRLQSGRIVLLRHKQAEKKGIDSALAHSRQVGLSIVNPDSDVSAVIELAVDHMDMCIEYECSLMQLPGLVRDLGTCTKAIPE